MTQIKPQISSRITKHLWKGLSYEDRGLVFWDLFDEIEFRGEGSFLRREGVGEAGPYLREWIRQDHLYCILEEGG